MLEVKFTMISEKLKPTAVLPFGLSGNLVSGGLNLKCFCETEPGHLTFKLSPEEFFLKLFPSFKNPCICYKAWTVWGTDFNYFHSESVILQAARLAIQNYNCCTKSIDSLLLLSTTLAFPHNFIAGKLFSE